MKLGKIFNALAPVIAIAMAAGVSGCDGANFKIDGEEGKKLSELDLTGTPPEELVLLGPDEVEVTAGDKLAISVEGDEADRVRFTLKGGTLGILREKGSWSKGGKTALIHVTMPAPREVTMAGSGKITSAALAPNSKVTIAGSGLIETPGVSSESLELTIAGSGSYRGAGNVRSLEMTIAGSGSAAADALKVEKAKVTIAGSGDASFASDGEVDATIMGSGSVRVKGRASCKVSSMGSGKLYCETAPTTKDAPEPPEAPEAPESPE